ncbi:MAG: CoA-binding protein [Halobacteriaceae archaeon]
MPVQSDEELREILQSRRVAVVGCSTTEGKDAHDVPAYLQEQGYEVIPVNPFADEVLGETAYDSLEDVPGEVDVVDVFRPSEEVSGIVDAAIDRVDVGVVWLQLGIHDDEAVARAEDAGIRVVEDRCMRVEHRRLA